MKFVFNCTQMFFSYVDIATGNWEQATAPKKNGFIWARKHPELKIRVFSYFNRSIGQTVVQVNGQDSVEFMQAQEALAWLPYAYVTVFEEDDNTYDMPLSPRSYDLAMSRANSTWHGPAGEAACYNDEKSEAAQEEWHRVGRMVFAKWRFPKSATAKRMTAHYLALHKARVEAHFAELKAKYGDEIPF